MGSNANARDCAPYRCPSKAKRMESRTVCIQLEFLAAILAVNASRHQMWGMCLKMLHHIPQVCPKMRKYSEYNRHAQMCRRDRPMQRRMAHAAVMLTHLLSKGCEATALSQCSKVNRSAQSVLRQLERAAKRTFKMSTGCRSGPSPIPQQIPQRPSDIYLARVFNPRGSVKP